jgi:Family of unknown function (DUF6011)
VNDSNVTDARIRCGHCGDYHATVAEVRTCAATSTRTAVVAMTITEKQVTYLHDLMSKKQWPSEVPVIKDSDIETMPKAVASQLIGILINQPNKPQGMAIPESIPDGRYAYLSDEYGKIVFYRVVTGRDGVTRRVQKVLGSPGDFRYANVTGTEADKFIQAIVGDPGFASQLFGTAVGACGVCGSPLTDPESIRLGIGPICAKKYDW